MSRHLMYFGLQATFYFQFGTTVFNGLLLFYVLSPLPGQEKQLQSEDNITAIVPWCPIHVKAKTAMKSIFHPAVVTNTGMIFYPFGRLFYSAVDLGPPFFIPAVLQQSENDYTPTEAAFAVTIIGVFTMIGQLLSGFADCFPEQSLLILAILNTGCAASSIMIMTFQSSLSITYLGCSLFGLFVGPIRTLGPSCLANLVGTEYEVFSCALGLNLPLL